MKYIKKHIKVILILILLITSIILYAQTKFLQFQILEIKAVPSVELINYLSIDNNFVTGGITGFVKFNDKQHQPIDMQQYIKITALNQFDSDGNQIFVHQDVIKMKVLSPRFFDPVYLTAISTEGNKITLSDNSGNLFFINKNTKELEMFETDSGTATLITDKWDFRNFIYDFYK